MPVDTHVTIVPYFTVPPGKMDEFKSGFADFYKLTKAGTKECLYYGFCICENKVFCREGYTSAAGVLAHLGDVKGPLDKALEIVGPGNLDLSVMGPQSELAKLKEAMGPLGTKFWATDGGNIWFKGLPGPSDTHVSMVPYFKVPPGKMEEFKASFPDFYARTKKGTKECLYYGFCIHENTVFCREGYESAAGVFAHQADVKEAVEKAVAFVGFENFEFSVMGPQVEIDKLKPAFGPLGAKFWATDAGSMWLAKPSRSFLKCIPAICCG